MITAIVIIKFNKKKEVLKHWITDACKPILLIMHNNNANKNKTQNK